MNTRSTTTQASCCDTPDGPDRTSAVDFANTMRVHIALASQDVEASTAFYECLFQQAPTKVRERYAKFELAEPPLNLSLNQVDTKVTGATGLPHHMGIQVKSTAAVERIAKRMMAAGLHGREEEQVACCYAVQDKVWFTDPDGHQWEVFVVTDAESTQLAPKPAADVGVDESGKAPCCG